MFAAQSNLFERPGLAGLAGAEAIVTPTEERALFPPPWTAWRRRHSASTDGSGSAWTASCGWRYHFSTGSFGPTDPIPNWLLPLRKKAAAFARLSPEELVQALVIRYAIQAPELAGIV